MILYTNTHIIQHAYEIQTNCYSLFFSLCSECFNFSEVPSSRQTTVRSWIKNNNRSRPFPSCGLPDAAVIAGKKNKIKNEPSSRSKNEGHNKTGLYLRSISGGGRACVWKSFVQQDPEDNMLFLRGEKKRSNKGVLYCLSVLYGKYRLCDIPICICISQHTPEGEIRCTYSIYETRESTHAPLETPSRTV